MSERFHPKISVPKINGRGKPNRIAGISTLLADRQQIGLPSDFIRISSGLEFVLAIYVAVNCRPIGVKPNGTHFVNFEPQCASMRAGFASN